MLKSVVYFKEGVQGWSEVYTTNHENVADYCGLTADSFNPGSLVDDFVQARRTLLNQKCVLQHIRVSKVGSPGNFDTHDYPDDAGIGTYPGETNAVEIPVCLLVKLQAGTTRRKVLYLGGIPETIVTPPMTYKPNDLWNPRLAAFKTIMQNGTYLIPGRPARSLLTESVISNFVVNSTGQTATITPKVAPDPQPSYWYVLVRGLKTPRGWNGVHKATGGAISADMTIGPAKKTGVSLPAFAFSPSATVCLYIPVTTAVINDVEANRIVKHDRGRPFGVPRGRR